MVFFLFTFYVVIVVSKKHPGIELVYGFTSFYFILSYN